MAQPVAAIVSYRLGGSDGVSVESAKWAWALGELGFEVLRVAGEGEADRILPALAMHSGERPSVSEVEDALAPADLVVVENLCSLPLNPDAGSVVAEVLRGRWALLHHHDLPWQRPAYAGFGGPPVDPRWAHVTVNQMSCLELATRGIAATVVRNTFDVGAPAGDRERTRSAIGLAEHDTLVLQPTRAIARKNVAGAIALCEALDATFWLLGPAEDGFGPELERLVGTAGCPVVMGRDRFEVQLHMEDAYAACDLVVLPSTWEGFGNPAIESAVHRRPLAIGTYPVAAELASFGFRWFSSADSSAVAAWLEQPSAELVEHNHRQAQRHFSLADLPGRIARVLEAAGLARA
ncbi:MAG TPA: hypothetical protein VMR97_00235 [Acidimicrobiales bacterium]|nr:hypothetical protein [Acidimicrobiales bacterium]